MTRSSLNLIFLSVFSVACGGKEDSDTAGLTLTGLTAEDENPAAENEDDATSDEDASNEQDDGTELGDSDGGDDDADDSGGDDASGDEPEGFSENGGEGSDSLGESGDGEETTDGEEDSSERSDGESVVVDARDLPAPLPPTGSRGTLETVTEVAPEGTIRDVNVSIDLEHSCTKDLVALLRSPSGTEVVLFDLRDMVVCSSDLSDTEFDDGATVPISGGSTPFIGAHKPTGYLSDFIGEEAAGIWRLSITDDMVGDKGSLKSWSIKLIVD